MSGRRSQPVERRLLMMDPLTPTGTEEIKMPRSPRIEGVEDGGGGGVSQEDEDSFDWELLTTDANTRRHHAHSQPAASVGSQKTSVKRNQALVGNDRRTAAVAAATSDFYHEVPLCRVLDPLDPSPLAGPQQRLIGDEPRPPLSAADLLLLKRRPSSTRGGREGELSKKARCVIMITTLVLIFMSILLVGITLRLAPVIDDLVRKENEEFLRVIDPSIISSSTTPSLVPSSVAPDLLINSTTTTTLAADNQPG